MHDESETRRVKFYRLSAFRHCQVKLTAAHERECQRDMRKPIVIVKLDGAASRVQAKPYGFFLIIGKAQRHIVVVAVRHARIGPSLIGVERDGALQ